MTSIIINGLSSCFLRKLPFRVDNITFYRIHRKTYVRDETLGKKINCNTIYNADFLYREPLEIYTNCDITSIRKVLNKDLFNFNKCYIDKTFQLGIYFLANHFQGKLIDLDTQVISNNGNYTVSSYKNYKDNIDKCKKLLSNIIDKNSTIYYSIQEHIECNKKIFHANLSILKYISSIVDCKNIYVGGEFIYKLSYKYLKCFDNYNIVFGSNLSNFCPEKKIQYLTNDYCDNMQSYKFISTMDQNNLYSNDNRNIFPELEFQSKTFSYNFSKHRFCNGICAFCTESAKGNKYNGLGEIQTSLRGFQSFVDNGFNSVIILDPHITHTLLFKPIVDYIIKYNVKINIFCGVRLKDLTEEKAKILRQIGVKAVNVGIETIYNDHLKYIQKNISIEEIKEKLYILHDNNLFINTNFVLNMPYAKDKEVEKLVDWLSSFEEGVINGTDITPFIIYDECEFARNPKKFKIKRTEFPYVPYVENTSTISNIIQRQKQVADQYMDYYNTLSCFDFHVNAIFSLYEKYKYKNIVWQKYKSTLIPLIKRQA